MGRWNTSKCRLVSKCGYVFGDERRRSVELKGFRHGEVRV